MASIGEKIIIHDELVSTGFPPSTNPVENKMEQVVVHQRSSSNRGNLNMFITVQVLSQDVSPPPPFL